MRCGSARPKIAPGIMWTPTCAHIRTHRRTNLPLQQAAEHLQPAAIHIGSCMSGRQAGKAVFWPSLKALSAFPDLTGSRRRQVGPISVRMLRNVRGSVPGVPCDESELAVCT